MLHIHKASAGSGKTYTLTQWYLQLLLGKKATDGPDKGRFTLHPLSSYGTGKAKHHGAILAITFTNKATEEMVSRIVNELAVLAGAHDDRKSPYLSHLLALFRTDEATLAKHAKAALTDLLFHFSWFNVSTIDSFFQRVLGNFTRELDLSPSLAIELDEKYPLRVALADMLSSLNHTPTHDAAREGSNTAALQMWITQYMVAEAQEGNKFNILSRNSSLFSSLAKSIGNLYTEKYRMHRGIIDPYVADPSKIMRFKTEIARDISLREAEIKKLAKTLLDYEDPRFNKAKYKCVVKASEGDFSFTTTFLENIGDPEYIFVKPTAKKPFIQVTADLTAELFARIKAYWEKKQLTTAISKWLFYLGLFGEVNRALDRFRAENDTMLMSDTGDLLHKIIDEQETPFIYDRIGTNLRHYLIDEFQDTSRLQWENLSPLLLESLSRGNDNLVIGDEKQCIYRFRNSDPQLLGSEVQSIARNRHMDCEIKGLNTSENCNWRSAPQVVRFNNSVFARMAELIDDASADQSRQISGTYAALMQDIAEKNLTLPGRVQTYFIPAEQKDEDAPQEETNEPEKDSQQLRLLTDEIRQQLIRGYKPSDIAVLVRTAKEGRRIIKYLLQQSTSDSTWPGGPLQITSADSMAVDMSPAVSLIISAMRVMADPSIASEGSEMSETDRSDAKNDRSNDDLMADINRYRLITRFELETYTEVPCTGPDGEPAKRTLTPSEALLRALAAQGNGIYGPDETQQHINVSLKELQASASPTLLGLANDIVDRFITPEARAKENPFITAFFDLVADFSQRGENSLRQFLQWWDRTGHTTSVENPGSDNALSVMTIHKSKGLEFACVHVPGFSSPLVKYDSPGWYTLGAEYFPELPADCVPPMIPLKNSRQVISLDAFSSEGRQWETEQKTDALNVAYVAFTRAVRELVIYVNRFNSDATPARRTIGNELYDALATLDADTVKAIAARHAGADDAESLLVATASLQLGDEATAEAYPGMEGLQVFAYGEPTVPVSDRKDMSETIRSADEAEAKRLYKGSLEEYYINHHDNLRAKIEEGDITDFSLDNSRHAGIFMHEVLAQTAHRSDLSRAVRGRAYRRHIPKAEAEALLHSLESAFDAPEIKEHVQRWFTGFDRVFTERTLSDAAGARRPDRVVFLADGSVEVVDYKFGTLTRDESGCAVTEPQYRSQLLGYSARLKQAGHARVRAFLWYPLEKEIIEVTQ